MSDSAQFVRLLEPGRIGKMSTKNRIVMSAMGTRIKPEGRHGIDVHRAYYEVRARGGVGMVITEVASVDYQRGGLFPQQFRIDDDKFIPGMSEIADSIKRHGARAIIQLHHGGSAAKSAVIGQQPVGPSSVERLGHELARELTRDEIADIVARFAEGAERAQKAGFDGIEIHSAHYYLIAEFLSAAWNRRRDEYGGNLENRARLLLEIIRAIKETVGTDYPVWCKLNGIEFGVEGGVVIEETRQVAIWAQEAGADAINVSGQIPISPPYRPEQPLGYLPPAHQPGYFVDFAAAVKKVVGVPVIVAGKISPSLGEKVLRQGKADFIALGRSLIADPELPNKLMSGRMDEITTCVYCNCCVDPVFSRDCTVNAAKGSEREYEIKPVERKKRVLVVGGGPAGMEAARIAALRGHEVILYEKNRILGGQLILASIIRKEYEGFTRYLTTQMKRRGVKVSTGQEVTPALVESIKPDVVILATGPVLAPPETPGIGGDNVFSLEHIAPETSSTHDRKSSWLSTARWRKGLWTTGIRLLGMPWGLPIVKWLIGFIVPVGRKVVVLGGGLRGLQLANYLVEKGKDVVILETGPNIEGGERPMYLLMEYYFKKLTLKRVNMLASVKCERITHNGLVIEDRDGKRRFIEADAIMLATGAKRDDRLAKELEGKVPEIHLVGDCADPCGIREAVAAGALVGNKV